jgi:hypothetical protein
VLKNNDPDRAINLLVPIQKEVDSPQVQVMLIEAACASKKTTDKQKEEAKAAIPLLKDKITPPEELGRVAAICDPKLPETLGLPVPSADGSAPATPAPAKPAKPAKGGRRHR